MTNFEKAGALHFLFGYLKTTLDGTEDGISSGDLLYGFEAAVRQSASPISDTPVNPENFKWATDPRTGIPIKKIKVTKKDLRFLLGMKGGAK